MRSERTATPLVHSLVDRLIGRLFWVVPLLPVLLLVATTAAAQTAADPPAAQEPPQPATAVTTASNNSAGGVLGFLRKMQVVVDADGYYDYNANGVSDQLRNFDTRDTQPSLSMAKLGLVKTPTADERFGFRVDVHAGTAATMIHASDPAQNAVTRHVEQAYLSFLAPLGKGLQIDFGEFVTPHGAEVIEAADNWNYSRSLLFALAIPYYHMGLRATYALDDKVSLMGTVVNGWNNVVDNNRAKTYGAQLALKPTSKVSIVQNYMAGPEQPQDTRDWRQLSDTVVTYALTKALSVTANYDYGRDTLAGVPVHWQGVAGYARYQIAPRVAVAPRLEWYDDASGFTTGKAQRLREVTATGEFKLGRGFLWRVECRHDSSAALPFVNSTGEFVRGQTTVGMGVLYSFSSK